MLDISKDIQPLISIKRQTAKLVKRMKQTKRPLEPTVNRKAELVVQDAES